MVRQSFFELPKSTFVIAHCAVVPAHLGYAIEANLLNQRTAIYPLGRLQRHAAREGPQSRAKCKNASPTQLHSTRVVPTLPLKVFKVEINLGPSNLFLPLIRIGLRRKDPRNSAFLNDETLHFMCVLGNTHIEN